MTTKQDLSTREHRADLGFDRLDESVKSGLATIQREIRAQSDYFAQALRSQTRMLVVGMVGVVVIMEVLAFALALTG